MTVARTTRAAGRALGLAFLVLLLTFLAIAQTAGTADALTVATTGGSYPGTATTPKATVGAPRPSDCNPPAPCVIGQGFPYLLSNPRTVNENPTYRNDWQWVCVMHRLLVYRPWTQYWAESWDVIDSETSQACGWISPAATSITAPGHAFDLAEQSKQYSHDVVISWQLPSGYLLGQKRYSYDRTADYDVQPALQAGVMIYQGYLLNRAYVRY
jgi:hypothetical protein